MSLGRRLRRVVFSILVGTSIAACQTLEGPHLSTSQAPENPSTKRLSQEFYLPFYDQTDHLKFDGGRQHR